jgi:hypothetical protein
VQLTQPSVGARDTLAIHSVAFTTTMRSRLDLQMHNLLCSDDASMIHIVDPSLSIADAIDIRQRETMSRRWPHRFSRCVKNLSYRNREIGLRCRCHGDPRADASSATGGKNDALTFQIRLAHENGCTSPTCR